MYKFKFFEGLDKNTIVFDMVDLRREHGMDIEDELTRTLSEQIAQEIDNDIINEITRRINDGQPSEFEGPIRRLNENANYLNYWLSIGDNRA